MTQQTIIQEPEEIVEYTTEESAASDIAVIENSETGLVIHDAVTIDTSAYAGQPINRDLSAG